MLTGLNFQAPYIEMKHLNNLWLQITGLTCNLKCRHCYLSCNPTNKTKNFLNMDKIKKALEEVNRDDLDEICLTGGEPLLHRDINNIIRHCIKYTNVNIITNGTLINDKKARFLRQIEIDSDYEIVFRISLDHYKEHKNDEIRGKGSYKKTVNGIKSLVNNGFNPVINAVNLWEEDENEFREGFYNFLSEFNFEPSEMNLKIIPPVKTGEYRKNFSGYGENDLVTGEGECPAENFDCHNTRVIADDGVYVCPALVNDPRGKVGDTLSDSQAKFFLELNTCFSCQQANKKMFNNEWDLNSAVPVK
ncbi:MAG: radical SAM protein [Candidatus Lokiarchaeota archaeon]|nr:radical SAM protein [Candidatus Lokiarchaeota archaeon]